MEALKRSRSQLHVSPARGTPSPFTRYYSTIRVSPVTQGGASFVEWWSTYDCEPEDEKAMDDLLAGTLYAGGLAAVEARFG